MRALEWTSVATEIGECGIVWSEGRLLKFLLPEADAAGTRAKLARLTGKSEAAVARPAWVEALLGKVVLHFRGEPQDFGDVPIAFDTVTEFRREVYFAAMRIPAGEIRTYRELAEALGKPGASRAVGQALGRNPFPLLVPCHRIVAAGRKPGGFSAPGGLDTKAKMLACEGYRL